MTLRTLIVDDESRARARVRRILASAGGVEVVGEAGNAGEARDFLESHDVDLLVLDVAMPGTNGIELLESLSDDAPMVILCTAHREHAVDAFALGAIDYVVKPVDAARLELALSRAKTRATKRDAKASTATAPVDRLPLKTQKGVLLLDPSTITHVVLDGELVKVVTLSGAHLSDMRLSELEERFDSANFLRVHRRGIVNLAHVTRLAPLPTGGYTAHLEGGGEVEVSRQAARELRRALGL